MTAELNANPYDTPCPEIGNVCRDLIAAGRKISLRAVATELGVAHTTLSRDAAKRSQVLRCQELAKTVKRLANNNRGRLGEGESLLLAEAKRKISDLERQNAVLIASHQAMIMAVGELGGMRAWRRFFEDYQHILDYLEESGALGQKDGELTELDRG
ncbi:MAG: hypothetical protein VX529_14150 [Pseudomonadota bacterium]|nr:hypothetical protein [Pseudomonadota bacterium]